MKDETKKRIMEEQQKQARIEEILKQALTPEAKTRLGNIKLVNNELYLNAVQAVLYFFKNSGQKINEEQVKQLLEKLSFKREIKIRRK